MKRFVGFEKGMGIGGWLTNYKRFATLPMDRRMVLTVGDFEHFESYITEKDVKYIASLGLDHIRLGFDQLVLEESPYVYRDSMFNLIDQFINWCYKYNLNVVLNMHKAIGNYCDVEEAVQLLDSDELQDRFVAMWVEIEKRFSSYKDVAFELLNEVRNVDPDKWNNLVERTIGEIRYLNLERKIIVGGTCNNSPLLLNKIRVYDDDNVIYTFHQYEPSCFTHQQSVLQPLWLYYNRKMPYPGDIERYRDCRRVACGEMNPYPQYDRMDKHFIDDQIKYAVNFMKENPDKILWCGEFGTIRHADIKWRENWMRDMITALKENEIPYCVWNYLSTPNDANKFSLVDDDNRKIISEEMARIIRGEI